MSMYVQCFFKLTCPNRSGLKQWRQQHISSIACQATLSTEESLTSSGTTKHLRREIYRPSNPSAASSTLMSRNNDAKHQAKLIPAPLKAASLAIWTQQQCTGYGTSKGNASSTLT